ncbi:MAG: DNA adenine methylase [Planctomycetota bacterium]
MDATQNIPAMKINAFVPWFGSKRTLAPVIVTELGKHRMYFEPFCGSMAVLFAKKPSPNETANDMHGHLINLARVLQDEQLRPELYEELQSTLYSTDLFNESRAFMNGVPHVETAAMPSFSAAYHYFIVSWMGRNGTAGTERINYQKATRWTPGGGSGPTRFRNAVSSIPAWAERLRNVDIQNIDGFELINKVSDEPGVVIYADPPYKHRGRGGARYEHEFDDGNGGIFAGLDDHARLASSLRRFENARVVVSYYDDAEIRELYDRWTVVDHTRQKNLHVQNRRGAGECDAPEILLINGKSYGGAS